MAKEKSEVPEKSDWRRASDAMKYFHIGRTCLDRIAPLADAKRKIGGIAFYNVKKIETYLESE